MEHAIISKESFPIIGVELKTTTHDGRNLVEIPRFWQKVIKEGQIDKIPNKKFKGTVLGICMDFKPEGRFSYIIGSEVSSTVNTPGNMVCRTIPAATYAVFTARGKMPGSIQVGDPGVFWHRFYPGYFQIYSPRGAAEFRISACKFG